MGNKRKPVSDAELKRREIQAQADEAKKNEDNPIKYTGEPIFGKYDTGIGSKGLMEQLKETSVHYIRDDSYTWKTSVEKVQAVDPFREFYTSSFYEPATVRIEEPEVDKTTNDDPEWARKVKDELYDKKNAIISNTEGKSYTDLFEAIRPINKEIEEFEKKLNKYKRGALKASEVIENEETLAEDALEEDEECVINLVELASFYAEKEIISRGESIEDAKVDGLYEVLMEDHMNIIKSFKRNTNA